MGSKKGKGLFLRRWGIVLFLFAGGIAGLTAQHNVRDIKRVTSLQGEVEVYLRAFDQGTAPYDKGRFRQALGYYQRLCRLHPEDALNFGHLGYCYYHLGREWKAIAAYQKALALEPQRYRFSWDLGMILYQVNDFEQAVQYLSRALDLMPEEVQAYVDWGKKSMGTPASGPITTEVLRVNRRAQLDEEQAIHVFADSYLQMAQVEMMRQAAVLGLDKHPQSAMLKLDLGIAEFLSDNLPAAERYLDESLNSDPDHFPAYYYRRMVREKLGKIREAMQDGSRCAQFKKAGATMRPKFPLHLNLGLEFVRYPSQSREAPTERPDYGKAARAVK